MEAARALLVLFLVSYTNADQIDVSSACEKVYQSLNIILEHYPKDYGIEFHADNTPFLNYTNGKAYLNLPFRIGEEGCKAQVTEKYGSKIVDIRLSGVFNFQLKFTDKSFIVENAHLRTILSGEVREDSLLLNPSFVNVTNLKVYLVSDGNKEDVTQKIGGPMASTIGYEASKFLNKVLNAGREQGFGEIQYSVMFSLISAAQVFFQWAYQEVGYETGLIR